MVRTRGDVETGTHTSSLPADAEDTGDVRSVPVGAVDAAFSVPHLLPTRPAVFRVQDVTGSEYETCGRGRAGTSHGVLRKQLQVHTRVQRSQYAFPPG